jgi:general secretion pathway protein B
MPSGSAVQRQAWPIWAPLLAVVLAVNIGFMAWLWYDKSTASAPADPMKLSAPIAAAVPAAVSATAPAVRALAREATAVEPVVAPEVDSDLPREPPATHIAERPVAVAARPDVGKGSSPASKIISDPGLPTVEQLIGAGMLDLPVLNLDLLVYNDVPGVRFVVINGRKYREGAQLAEGPTLESITPEGVVLASQGQRFTLNRK